MTSVNAWPTTTHSATSVSGKRLKQCLAGGWGNGNAGDRPREVRLLKIKSLRLLSLILSLRELYIALPHVCQTRRNQADHNGPKVTDPLRSSTHQIERMP